VLDSIDKLYFYYLLFENLTPSAWKCCPSYG